MWRSTQLRSISAVTFFAAAPTAFVLFPTVRGDLDGADEHALRNTTSRIDKNAHTIQHTLGFAEVIAVGSPFKLVQRWNMNKREKEGGQRNRK